MRISLPFRYIIALMTLAVTATSYSLAAEPSKPEETAGNFYDLLRKHDVNGLPQGESWAALKPLLTPELAKAIESAQKEQADFIKKYPEDKPPFIEGDLFSSLFEGAQTHKIGAVKLEGDTAEVTIDLSYKDDSGTTNWTDTLVLKKAGESWLVADLKYGGNWDFAPKGTLLDALKPEQN